MFFYEIGKILRKPKFWVMALLIGIMKFSAVYTSDSYLFEEVFVSHTYSRSLFYLDTNDIWYGELILWIICFCAYAVSDLIIDDINENRLNYLLSRCGCLKYSFCKTGALYITSFVCMLFGEAVFLLMSTVFTDLVFFPQPGSNEEEEYIYNSLGDLLNDGRYLQYLLLWIALFCLFGVFVSLLTTIFSLWVRDKKFIIVFSVILVYFIFYVFSGIDMDFYTGWMNPRFVFTLPRWMEVESTMYGASDVFPVLYAFVYTLVVAVIMVCILYNKIDRWKKRGIF